MEIRGVCGVWGQGLSGLVSKWREVRVLEGKIKEGGEEGDGASTKVFQVKHRNVVGTGGSR